MIRKSIWMCKMPTILIANISKSIMEIIKLNNSIRVNFLLMEAS